ncbi:MAG: proteasome assembly chaperone family protein [Promethearchaeota archaeon]
MSKPPKPSNLSNLKLTDKPVEIRCADHLQGKSSRIAIYEEHCDFLKDVTSPPLFIIGFAGVGMIGTIVANELIKQLEMTQIGYILSEDLPPITVFYDGVLKHPFRLYYHQSHNLIVSICEVPFNPGSYTDLARTLMDWALTEGIKDVICFQGMAVESMIQESPVEIYAASEKEIMDKILAHDVKIPPRGLIMGAEAAILNECLNNHLDGAVFLTPANPQIPNPEGAAGILQKISEIYSIPVSLSGLEEQANQIKQSLLELAKTTDNVHRQGLPPGRDLYS